MKEEDASAETETGDEVNERGTEFMILDRKKTLGQGDHRSHERFWAYHDALLTAIKRLTANAESAAKSVA